MDGETSSQKKQKQRGGDREEGEMRKFEVKESGRTRKEGRGKNLGEETRRDKRRGNEERKVEMRKGNEEWRKNKSGGDRGELKET